MPRSIVATKPSVSFSQSTLVAAVFNYSTRRGVQANHADEMQVMMPAFDDAASMIWGRRRRERVGLALFVAQCRLEPNQLM